MPDRIYLELDLRGRPAAAAAAAILIPFKGLRDRMPPIMESTLKRVAERNASEPTIQFGEKKVAHDDQLTSKPYCAY